MYKCCIHILGCLLIWAIASSAQAASQQIHIDDPRFIKNPPAHILEKFTLDEDGYIIDGPRQADGEPIDHSILLSNQEIINNFLKVAFGGSELTEYSVDYVSSEARKWQKNIVKIKGKVTYSFVLGDPSKSNNTNESEFYNFIGDAVTLLKQNSNIDFSFKDEPLHKSVNFITILLNDDQIATQVSNAFYSDAMNLSPNSPKRKSLLYISHIVNDARDNRHIDMGYCGVIPTADSNSHIKTNIFILFTDRDTFENRGCVYEEFIQSMGLYRDDDSLNFSMFTDSFKNYNYPTEQDIWMLRILYDDRLKHGMTKEEALPIIYAVIDDIRPYGKN